MNISRAPIALFVYNRPDHTRRTVEALKKNALSEESDLIIFSDAAKLDSQVALVSKVRQYIRQIEGFKSVSIVEQRTNFGLARSIIDGVTAVVNEYGRIIVLEDDIVTSPYFLSYMNEALDKYSDHERVISIHGYVYPCEGPLPEAFFLRGADCWGWATWRRGWAQFNPDGQQLLDELKRRKLTSAFDFNGAYPFLEMLEDQIKGKNDSWAIRWYASAFLTDKLTLYPGRSLVHNIGFDDSGIHCGETVQYDSVLSQTPVDLSNIVVKPSQAGWAAVEKFFRGERSSRQQLLHKFFSVRGMKLLKTVARNWLPTVVFRWIRNMLVGRY